MKAEFIITRIELPYTNLYDYNSHRSVRVELTQIAPIDSVEEFFITSSPVQLHLIAPVDALPQLQRVYSEKAIFVMTLDLKEGQRAVVYGEYNPFSKKQPMLGEGTKMLEGK